MYDRLLRCALSESDRFIELHDDTHRLIFVALLWRANDFGCLECHTKAMTRWLAGFTQIKTREAFVSAVSALADADLVRAYQVDGKEYLFIPRFRSDRTYTSRARIPASPWCDADAPTGRMRVRHTPSVQVKPSSNQPAVTTLSEPSDKTPKIVQDVTMVNAVSPSIQPLELEPSDSGSTTLTGGVIIKEKRRVRADLRLARSLPEGWTIPTAWTDWATAYAASAGISLTARHVVWLADQFADYQHANGRRQTNWLATWRAWVRREDLARLLKRVPEAERDPFADGI